MRSGLKDSFKNIIAILLYIWAIPFQIIILIILFIGGIPIMLVGRILSFNRSQKCWRITKFFEDISNKLEAENVFK